MAGETVITVVGNLTSDPELRYSQAGLAVANFTIASTPRTLNRQTNEWVDGEALFLRASVWREFAEHVAHSLTKGSRVIVQGRLKQRSYETKEGEKRTSFELDVDEIGPSLRYATAEVHKQQQNQNQNQRGQQRQQQQSRDQGQVQNGGQQQGGQQQGPHGQEPWGQQQGGQQQQGGDVWSNPGGGTYNDETPF
jgi:single-strand DNA-binding protein